MWVVSCVFIARTWYVMYLYVCGLAVHVRQCPKRDVAKTSTIINTVKRGRSTRSTTLDAIQAQVTSPDVSSIGILTFKICFITSGNAPLALKHEEHLAGPVECALSPNALARGM